MTAPYERRETIASELPLPTFARQETPLPRDLPPPPLLPSCGGGVEQIGRRIRYMKPEFISEIAAELASRSTREKDGCQAESVIPALPGFIS